MSVKVKQLHFFNYVSYRTRRSVAATFKVIKYTHKLN